MKKAYEGLKAEKIEFNAADIITSSGGCDWVVNPNGSCQPEWSGNK